MAKNRTVRRDSDPVATIRRDRVPVVRSCEKSGFDFRRKKLPVHRIVFCVLLSAAVSAVHAQDASPPKWIWINIEGQPAQSVQFRREFDGGGVAAARLYATCDDQMTVFLDGKRVLESTSWETPAFVDLSGHLDLDAPQTRHVLAVEARNSGGSAGLLVKLDLESGWRKSSSIVSDADWQASTTAQPGWTAIDFETDDHWQQPDVIAELGEGPWAEKVNADSLAAAAPLKTPTATAAGDLRLADGFQAELLYSVPKEVRGSWVNMCVDPKGRLIVSDQYGSLYRVTVPSVAAANRVATNQSGASGDSIFIEKIAVDIGEAQGLLWAFDSLYVSVNRGANYQAGLYRVKDTDGDDQLDSVETLRLLNGRGEHGPHAVLMHPDGKSLVVVCGNGTELTELARSRVPTWDEDLLLPRVQGKFMLGKRVPGGCIYRVDPDGTAWELLACGFRNQYDAAFNSHGELFTYDADMEWDINTPWYRPTRICHVVSGADFGWRSSGGKWPEWYPDSVPPVINIGPGSPTGLCFGYGAHFPEKYRNALFAADWSFGKLYAVHLQEKGAGYSATLEEFVTGTPLPLTDVIVSPHDGALYFLIGGRRVQSGLYRVTHKDAANFTTPPPEAANGNGLPADHPAATRWMLEAAHVSEGPFSHRGRGLDWFLKSDDPLIRHAARIALEHRPAKDWQDEALQLTDPQALLTSLLALARSWERPVAGVAPDIDVALPDWDNVTVTPERSVMTSRILHSLNRLDPATLTEAQSLELLRVLTLTFVRIGPPNADERRIIVDRLEGTFPTPSTPLNSEVAQLMVWLQAPYAAQKLVTALENAPTHEEQMDYARTLRHLTTGWTPELRERYFRWFTRAATYRGGASFQLFVSNIKADAMGELSEAERTVLQPILDATPEADVLSLTAEPRPFVREWTLQELVPLVESRMRNRSFENGRRMFGAAKCFACHRFDGQGGAVGPDLTSLSGRFSSRDLLESIIEPSKQISDQYGSVQIVTLDGRTVTGRIINLAGDAFRVQTDMLQPGALTNVDRRQIEEIIESKISMMPTGLLNTLQEEEVLDLMAYMLSRGDRQHEMFGP